jgi:hypothetical protein
LLVRAFLFFHVKGRQQKMKKRGRTQTGVGVIIILATLLCMPIAAMADRFVDNNNGTVTDTSTGLVWLKNANASEFRDWYDNVTYCSSLASGMAGLTDGSVAGQWRLPSKEELEGIGTEPPATWSSGYPSVNWTKPGAPFINVPSRGYWSSESYAANTNYAWSVNMANGFVDVKYKAGGDDYLWPVRGPITTTTTIPINDGLIAYYPFNGNANDESGNGHNGTVYGSTLTADRFGNVVVITRS